MAAKPAPKKKTEASAPAKKEAPAAKAEKAPKAPKVEREVQNEITRPKADSATGKVWELADTISKREKRPATRAEVFEANAALGDDAINEATVATQYQRWRVFNGVERAAPAPKPAKEAKAPKAPKAPKAK